MRPYSFFLLLLVLIGCSAFQFKYYGLSEVVYDHGKLLGHKPKDDLAFSMCAPDASSKNKCVVMFATEFFSFKQEYEDVKNQLKECQKK